MKGKTLTCIILSFLVMLVLFLSNCGGSSDNGAIPDVASPQQTQQNLVNKDISGYVYHVSSLSSSETDEEEEDFSILEVPITGEDGFITQVNEYFQTEPSSRAGSPERVELQNAFTEEASCYVPLNSWNPGATLFSVYSDSENFSSIPVGAEGEISSSVPVDAGDDLVSLEIGSPEGEYYETETISTSDFMTTSEAGINLKSCPKQILIKPGECEIFKVFSKPSANLYDAGLQFSLANPEYGCVAGPIFIKCKGSKQTGVAYGIVYVKKSLDTTLDTAINVTASGGQSLSIPVQIVKKTAVVSGKVYAGGPILKGHVVSQGPKSQCKINEDGTYSLPKVWQGTGRKITATWWVMEGNRKVRYRETKYVDVFGDVTVNFGVVPTPTFPPPTDEYYDNISAKIIEQKSIWQEELGWDLGREKTIDWLNKVLINESLPYEIAEAIEEAKLDEYDPYTMLFSFKSGIEVSITDPQPNPLNANTSQNKESYNQSSDSTIITNAINQPSTVKDKVLILAPRAFEDKWNKDNIFDQVKSTFEDKYSTDNVKYLGVTNYAFGPDFPPFSSDGTTPYTNKNPLNVASKADIEFDPILPDYTRTLICHIKPGHENVVPYPIDYLQMDEYGVIFIYAHGSSDQIMVCPYYKDNNKLESWLNTTDINNWRYSYGFLSVVYDDFGGYYYGLDPGKVLFYKAISLKTHFFTAQPTDFRDSLIYVSSCDSWNFFYNNKPFPNVKVYVGFDGGEPLLESSAFVYNFFKYMLALDTGEPAMNVRDAFNKADDIAYAEWYSPHPTKIYTGSINQYDNTYLPGNIDVIVHKK